MELPVCLVIAFCTLLIVNASNGDFSRSKRNAEWLFTGVDEDAPGDAEVMEHEAERGDHQLDMDEEVDVSGESVTDEDIPPPRFRPTFQRRPQRFEFARAFPWTRGRGDHRNPRIFNKINEARHPEGEHRQFEKSRGFSHDREPRLMGPHLNIRRVDRHREESFQGHNPYANKFERDHDDVHKTIIDLGGRSLLEGRKPHDTHSHPRFQATPQHWNRDRFENREHSGMERDFHGDRHYRGPPAEHYRHKVPERRDDKHNDRDHDDKNHFNRIHRVNSHFPGHPRNPYRDQRHGLNERSWRYHRIPPFRKPENHNHKQADDTSEEMESLEENGERTEMNPAPLEEANTLLAVPVDQCPAMAEIGNCNFFRCFEDKHPCHIENNFMINVGLRLCETTDRKLAEFGVQGQAYIGSVRRCHMKKMLQVYERDDVPCEHINKFGLGILTPDTTTDCFLQGDMFCNFINDPQNAVALFHVYGGTGIIEYRLLMHFAKIIETCDDHTKDVFTENYARKFLMDLRSNGLSFHNMSQFADMDKTIKALLHKAEAHRDHHTRDSRLTNYRHENHRHIDHWDEDKHGQYFEKHNEHKLFDHRNLLNSNSPFAHRLISNERKHVGLSPLREFHNFGRFTDPRNPLHLAREIKPFTLPRFDKLHNSQHVPNLRDPHTSFPFARGVPPHMDARRILQGMDSARQISRQFLQSLSRLPYHNLLQKPHEFNDDKHGSPFSRKTFLNLGFRNPFDLRKDHDRGLFRDGGRMRDLIDRRPSIQLQNVSPQHSDVLNIRKQQAGQIVNIRNLNEDGHLLPMRNIPRGPAHVPFLKPAESRSPYASQRHRVPGLFLTPLVRGQ